MSCSNHRDHMSVSATNSDLYAGDALMQSDEEQHAQTSPNSKDSTCPTTPPRASREAFNSNTGGGHDFCLQTPTSASSHCNSRQPMDGAGTDAAGSLLLQPPAPATPPLSNMPPPSHAPSSLRRSAKSGMIRYSSSGSVQQRSSSRVIHRADTKDEQIIGDSFKDGAVLDIDSMLSTLPEAQPFAVSVRNFAAAAAAEEDKRGKGSITKAGASKGKHISKPAMFPRRIWELRTTSSPETSEITAGPAQLHNMSPSCRSPKSLTPLKSSPSSSPVVRSANSRLRDVPPPVASLMGNNAVVSKSVRSSASASLHRVLASTTSSSGCPGAFSGSAGSLQTHQSVISSRPLLASLDSHRSAPTTPTPISSLRTSTTKSTSLARPTASSPRPLQQPQLQSSAISSNAASDTASPQPLFHASAHQLQGGLASGSDPAIITPPLSQHTGSATVESAQPFAHSVASSEGYAYTRSDVHSVAGGSMDLDADAGIHGGDEGSSNEIRDRRDSLHSLSSLDTPDGCGTPSLKPAQCTIGTQGQVQSSTWSSVVGDSPGSTSAQDF